MRYRETLAPVCAFIEAIGLRCSPGSVPTDSFLPGVAIIEGGLVYDDEQLGSPGDLLHEAGHLALTPQRVRPLLDGDVGAVIDDILATGLPDHLAPLNEAERSMIERSEPLAIAWSYAAACAAGVDPDCVFWEGGYGTKDGGSPMILRMQIEQGMFPGVLGLAQLGFCGPPPLFATPGQAAPFPAMRGWMAG